MDVDINQKCGVAAPSTLPPSSLPSSAASIDASYVARFSERNFQFRPAAEFIKLLRSLHCLPSGHRLWHNLCVENEIMPRVEHCVPQRPCSNSFQFPCSAPCPALAFSDLSLPPPLAQLVDSCAPNVSIKAQIKLQTAMGQCVEESGRGCMGYS